MTLVLRGLPEALAARLRAYRSRSGLSIRDAAVALLDAGLRAHTSDTEETLHRHVGQRTHFETDSHRE